MMTKPQHLPFQALTAHPVAARSFKGNANFFSLDARLAFLLFSTFTSFRFLADDFGPS